jgi:hypothetical protein
MFGGAKTVLPSFRLKKKRKVSPPPKPVAADVPVAHKVLRPHSSATMPKRNRRGRPVKTEEPAIPNNEQQNERLSNNNVPKNVPAAKILEPQILPQISDEFSIGKKKYRLPVKLTERSGAKSAKRSFASNYHIF